MNGGVEGRQAEDFDSARLVARFQAGETEAFGALYDRYFDRIYAYLHVVFKNRADAEDAAQQAFFQAFEALPGYQDRGLPFRSWLFAIARNHALHQLRANGRLEVTDPAELTGARERSPHRGEQLNSLNWITDTDLLIFIERLPLAQRQTVVLRYMLGFSITETATALGLSNGAVRQLQFRALAYLKKRLIAIGRVPARQEADRAPVRQFHKQAPVLRTRRYALTKM